MRSKLKLLSAVPSSNKQTQKLCTKTVLLVTKNWKFFLLWRSRTLLKRKKFCRTLLYFLFRPADVQVRFERNDKDVERKSTYFWPSARWLWNFLRPRSWQSTGTFPCRISWAFLWKGSCLLQPGTWNWKHAETRRFYNTMLCVTSQSGKSVRFGFAPFHVQVKPRSEQIKKAATRGQKRTGFWRRELFKIQERFSLTSCREYLRC